MKKIDKENYEEIFETEETTSKKPGHTFMKVFNIIFILLIIIMIMIATDVVCITKYNKGPFFAIKTETYKDGGTKVYYGLGYKVIKYNAIEGRKDTTIGLWSMKYINAPTEIEDLDLAIEFQHKPEKTAKKYYKQYLMINSTVKQLDVAKKELILEYTDPDGKYTFQTNCQMSEDAELSQIKVGDNLKVKGTAYKFSIKDDKKVNTIYLSSCYTE